jgi:hydroxypyruvate isomerase
MTRPSASESSRRDLFRGAAATVAAGVALGGATVASAAGKRSAAEGRLKQSVCRWCYGKISLEDLCSAAVGMGLVGIDLLGPADFETLKKHGLVCTMVGSGKLTDGLCDPQFHKASIESAAAAIEATSKEGWKNVICFSGNRRGIDDKVGMDNCVKALREIVPIAEKANVVLNMELLNSKVDHADYMCDNSKWGVELVKRVGSDNFKLLYDIYHMQIMEGDVIRTIEAHHDAFGHYHTGGNPGRNELDDTQELNYKAIARAIADTKDDVFFAHEFIPTRDPLTSLAEAVDLCIV